MRRRNFLAPVIPSPRRLELPQSSLSTCAVAASETVHCLRANVIPVTPCNHSRPPPVCRELSLKSDGRPTKENVNHAEPQSSYFSLRFIFFLHTARNGVCRPRRRRPRPAAPPGPGHTSRPEIQHRAIHARNPQRRQ